MKKKLILALFALTTILVGTFSCTKEVAKLLGPNDAQMYAWAKDSNNMTYMHNDPLTYWSPAGGSPHGTFRLRFNTVAKNALDAGAANIIPATFPDSSLIVKVGYTGPQGAVTVYAVMFKLYGSWVMSEYGPNGAVYVGVQGNISSCLSCHNGPNNHDQILSLFYHP